MDGYTIKGFVAVPANSKIEVLGQLYDRSDRTHIRHCFHCIPQTNKIIAKPAPEI